ncbi:MAG: hypothetical protein M3485_09165 [Pseudomonadota bacterium]|nr:hypothetical protein [Pseudomonadota bacterium]
MHDPIAAGRRAAHRAVAVQSAASAAVALVFLVQGLAHALAAGWGGVAMLAGHVLSVRVAFGRITPAGAALARLMLAMLAKWVVALACLAIGLGAWRLPPLPMVVGLAAGLLAYLMALHLGSLEFGRTKSGNGIERER